MATSGGPGGHIGSMPRTLRGRSAPSGGTQVPLPGPPSRRILGPTSGPSAQDRRIFILVRALIPGQRTRALTALIACALILTPRHRHAGFGCRSPEADRRLGRPGMPARPATRSRSPPPTSARTTSRRPSCASSSTARAHEMVPINASDSDMRDGARYRVRDQDQDGGDVRVLVRGAGRQRSRDEPRRRQHHGRPEAEAEADAQADPEADAQARATLDAEARATIDARSRHRPTPPRPRARRRT